MNRIRIILSIFILLFLAPSFSFAKSDLAFAQEELTIKKATESPELSKTSKRVEYQLPYPGLLPDSPLYFLKMSRDALVGFLIASPLKKADFYLLQADKRLNAGVYLFKIGKSKYDLAESTISKGENYFEKAIAKAIEAKKQGMDIKDIVGRLLTSSKKHQEMIKDLEANAAAKTKESLMALLKRSADSEKQAKLLIPK